MNCSCSNAEGMLRKNKSSAMKIGQERWVWIQTIINESIQKKDIGLGTKPWKDG